jgi:hypothetical protein
MNGAPDPLYVAARVALLDALEALGEQRRAVVLVGAQAVYLHTGEATVAVAPYTTDADLAIDPSLLQASPKLNDALLRAHFWQGAQPGSWIIEYRLDGHPITIEVDLLVPEAVAGGGRRAAKLGEHGDRTARRAKGLEAALVDHRVMTLSALEVLVGTCQAADQRTFDIRVAGPAALLVSKLHKVAERAVEQQRTRLHDKDALDIYRILQAVPAASLASTLTLLLERDVARDVTREAMSFLERYFANPRSLGCQMVVRATEGLEDSETIAQSCSILAKTLLTKMAHTHEESLGARDSDSRW